MTSTKKLSIALIISGALNFLFLGVIITAVIIRSNHMQPKAPRDIMTKRAIAGVSEDYREKVANIWQDHLSENRQDFKKTIEIRRDIKALLMAEDVNEKAIRDAIDEMHAIDDGLRQMQITALIEIAQTLPQEERETYFAKTRFGRPGDRGPRQKPRPPVDKR